MEKFNRVLILIFFYFELDLISYTSAQLGRYPFPNGEPRRVCGRDLSQALELICKGNFNPPKSIHRQIKKSSEDDAIVPEYWLDFESSTFPFQSSELARALLPGSFRRIARGVVSECCKKSCTVEEMATYCRKT